jgi:CRP-like cAMP-binding protein
LRDQDAKLGSAVIQENYNVFFGAFRSSRFLAKSKSGEELAVLARIPEEAQRRLAEQLTQWELPEEFVAELFGHHALVTFAKGEPVFLQGSTADVGFWILSGMVKVYSPNADGSRVVVALIGPGDLAGFTDYLDPNGRRAQAFEAEALTKASVALFTRDHVMKALQKLSPPQLVAVFEKFNTSWSSLACSYAQFLGMSFRDRLETVFANLAARFSVRDARGILLTVELSHDDLAEMIGSSRPMVSRLIAELISQRIIARQGKNYILLNNPAARMAENSPARGTTNNSAARGTPEPRMRTSGSIAKGSPGL